MAEGETTKNFADDYARDLGCIGTRGLPLKIGSLLKYLLGKVTPARELTNAAAAEIIPRLRGEIIEIGASQKIFSSYADPSSNYVLSNITNAPGFLYLDALNNGLADNSVDNYVCISVLEHIPDPFQMLSEVRRTLKPGGKLLLIVPFLYPFHPDPSDFFRFTDRGLAVLLKGFRVIQAESLGNSLSTAALILQKPLRSARVDRLRKENRLMYLVVKIGTSPVTLFCRLAGTIFYVLSFFVRTPSDYASMYCVLVEKDQA